MKNQTSRKYIPCASKNNKCCLCKTNKHLTIHHILPRSMGGTNDDENLAVLCYSCHDKIEDLELFNLLDFWTYIKMWSSNKQKNQIKIKKLKKSPILKIQNEIHKIEIEENKLLTEGKNGKRSIVYSTFQEKINNKKIQKIKKEKIKERANMLRKKALLLKFQDSEYDLYKELLHLTKHTKHTVSKEIRIAITYHLDFYHMKELYELAVKNNRTIHEEILIAIKQYLKPKKRWWKK